MSEQLTFNLSHIYTYLTYSDGFPYTGRRQVQKDLKKAMRAQIENFYFIQKHSKNRLNGWDGYVDLFSSDTFPTGLLPLALETVEVTADLYEFKIKIEGDQPSIDTTHLTDDMLYGITLRNYQMNAIRDLCTTGRGIAWMATGSGKTIVIAALCALVDGRSLVVVTGKDLLYQTADVIRSTTGLDVGLLGDGNQEMDEQVTVVTAQSLHRRLDAEWFKGYISQQQMLVLDECHHTSAKTVYEAALRIPSPYRFGFSGTPLKHSRLNDLQLMGITGDVVVKVSADDLVQMEYVARPVVHVNEIESTPLPGEPEYPEAYEAQIVKNRSRNILIADLALLSMRRGHVVLVLVERLEHQDAIYREIRKLGIDPVVLNGSMSADYRADKMDEMRSGEPVIVLATTIFDEGVDIPTVNTIILASGGKSHIRLLQRIGRGMRKKGGNNELRVIDILDKDGSFFEKQGKKRLKIYRQENFEVRMHDHTTVMEVE